MTNRFKDITPEEGLTLAELLALVQPTFKKETLGVQIVVADRGFVYVGHVEADCDWVYVTKAKCIRQWGTTKGLGQLSKGPTKDTKLDEAGAVRIPKRAVISLIECEEAKWATEL